MKQGTLGDGCFDFCRECWGDVDGLEGKFSACKQNITYIIPSRNGNLGPARKSCSYESPWQSRAVNFYKSHR